MFFDLKNLKLQKDYAGFKKCYVTRVSTRRLAPFGTAYPLSMHGESDVIVVCRKLQKPNEEWIAYNGGNLKELRSVAAYGFQNYWDAIKPDSFFDRMPLSDEEFAGRPGLEEWTRPRVEEHIKNKGINTFFLPRRFIFNQASKTCSFDFEYRLDAKLPGYLLSLDNCETSDLPTQFVSPRPPGPGVLTPDEIAATATPRPASGVDLCWVKPGALASLPVPDPSEAALLADAGIRAVASFGVGLEASAFESNGIRYLALPKTDEHDPDPEHIKSFAEFCQASEGAVAICSQDHQATGNMLGVALLTQGHLVNDALALLDAAAPENVETMAQIEFLYSAAGMLGIDIEID